MTFIERALATLLAALAVFASLPAAAAAPFQSGQAPGFHRMKLGDFEITTLYDGDADLDMALLHADANELATLLRRDFSGPKVYKGYVSGFLINTGSHLVLVDTGSGGQWGPPTLGNLARNLAAAGYRAADVDTVLLTHMHADHIAGITRSDGTRAFPNATVRMAQAESDFWLSKEIQARAPAPAQEFFRLAQAAAAPYQSSGRWQPFSGAEPLLPGIKPVPISGHTPGHSGYELSSKGQTLLIWGDVVHTVPVQVPRPDITLVFDIDEPAAARARQALFEAIASQGGLVAGPHLPFPAIGHLRKDTGGYAWVPVSYVAGPEGAATRPPARAESVAPGFYRFMLGQVEVTALSDGTAEFPVDQLMTATTPAYVNETLAKSFLQSPLETSGNAYLLNTGSRLILVDTGAGRLVGPTLGKLIANLRAAGYRPEQVDDIFLTHLHADHIGGLTDGDRMAFANATVHADRREAALWLDTAKVATARDVDKPVFEAATGSLAPYVKAGRFVTFDGETAFFPGFKAMPTHGHTAGHSSYVLESAGQKLVFWGDLIHVAAVQFDQPSIGILFDIDAAAAAAQRERVYADAAAGGFLVAASHIQFPGLGRVRSNGKAYAWVPRNYTLPK